MSLEHQAEILKLARVLDVDTLALAMLQEVDAASIRQLRLQAVKRIHIGDAPIFKRIVSASRLLPVPVLALIAEKVMGSLITARIAGQMDVERGVGIASRLQIGYLADVCLHLDPAQARELIRAIPQRQIVAVAQELAARDECVAMGRFVDILSEASIMAVVDVLDDAQLLRTAFFVENKQRLDSIIEHFAPERLIAIIRCAASDADLWPEALGLMRHLNPTLRGRLANLAASLDTDVLSSMLRSVSAHGLWSDALPIIADMSEESQSRFANLPDIQQTDVLLDIISFACAEGLWPDVLPLVRLMDDAGKTACAQAAEYLDGEQLLSLVRAASDHSMWGDVLDLVQRMNEPQKYEIVALMGMAPQAIVDTMLPAIDVSNYWDLLLPAWPKMTTVGRDRLRQAAGKINQEGKLPA
ncbi:hypothetical protein [Zhongshania aliphaticivorans]|uniref:hypothetical protein n=1 Tax=Zhongshania aliphaticivorans TaxID=1470434 RepID=UPI0012E6BCAB|nr:hypothetical protein [Zhongshania aliphaticivorans]CAA0106013.1 Uncharacterised protein [Zhongshania aliphaticivorans]